MRWGSNEKVEKETQIESVKAGFRIDRFAADVEYFVEEYNFVLKRQSILIDNNVWYRGIWNHEIL